MQPTQISHLKVLLESGLKQSVLMQYIQLSDYTTLRLGGPADFFCEIADETDAAFCIRTARDEKIPVLVLGRGSNLLFPDEGFRGLVLHFGDSYCNAVVQESESNTPLLMAQAGASLTKIAAIAADASLTGLEFAGGIPGSVGGGITMNAGAYGGELSQVLESVTLLDQSGEIRRISAEEMHMGYRHSLIMEQNPSLIVLSACIRLKKGNQSEIRNTMQDYAARRREKQPLRYPSCGSTFKRPEGHYAGALIEQCGLKGFRVGGCSISTLHAGFLLNDESGSSADYLSLIRQVQQIVYKKTGIMLEPEVQIVMN